MGGAGTSEDFSHARYIFICILIHICINMWIYICVHIFEYVYICLFKYGCMYMGEAGASEDLSHTLYIYIYIFIHTYICIYMNAYVYIWVYVYRGGQEQTRIFCARTLYICIYIYIHISNSYVCMYAYKCMNMNMCIWGGQEQARILQGRIHHNHRCVCVYVCVWVFVGCLCVSCVL